MIYVAGLLVVAAVAGVLAWRLLGGGSSYQQALGTLPSATLRTTYTDWALVRRQARGTSLDDTSSREQVTAFLNRAYDRGLTSGSGISESTSTLAGRFGFSPLDAEWEALGQSRKGQVDVLRLADGVDLTKVERALRRLGYDGPRPGSSGGGTWAGDADLVARISGDLGPLEQNIAVLPDQHLVLMSDDTVYVERAARVAAGSGSSLRDVAGVDALSDVAGDPVSAVQWASTFACEDLRMGSADSGDQREARQLVDRAGKISPLEGLVMAQGADRSIVVGMHFETSRQASATLQPRVDLATGSAPGQGGSFTDRFEVTKGTADGQDVVLHLRPEQPQVLSDISTGPVLFATC